MTKKGKNNLNLKKIGLVLATGAAALTLAACGKDSEDVVTMKGDTIRVSDLYNETKAYPTMGASTLLQNMTFNKIFEKEFGKKVSSDAVTKEYNTQKESYGTSFAGALQQAGYTETSYKAFIRSQLLLKEAITSKIKFTDDEYKQAFETYHPTVEAYVLPEATEEAAKADIAKSAEDFDKDAKEKKSDLKFDSSSTKVPNEVKEAAFKLKDGEVSATPIAVANTQTGAKTYYVVKMIKNVDKGTDWKKYKKELKEVISTTKQNDSTFVKGIIADYLKKYNVKVKPKEFNTIFAAYESAATTSSSSSSKKASSSSSEEKKSSSSETPASSEEKASETPEESTTSEGAE
jgi:foldase protein PrsA